MGDHVVGETPGPGAPAGRLPGGLLCRGPRRLALLWLLPLAVGVAVGGWLGWLALPQVAPKAPSSTIASLPVAAGQGRSGAPRACLQAVEQADAAISYLIGDIRDQRLDASLQRYVEAARSCRKETSP